MKSLLIALILLGIATVSVQVAIEMLEPKLKSNDYYVEVGATVRLKCLHPVTGSSDASTPLLLAINGKPPNVSDTALNVNEATEQDSTGKNLTIKLVISGVRFDHAGNYSCSFGSKRFSYHLYVFDVHLTSDVVTANKTEAILQCKTEYSKQNSPPASQPGRTSWFRVGSVDSEITDTPGEYEIQDLDDSLNISGIQYDSYPGKVGKYYCQIQPDENTRKINYTVSVNAAAGVKEMTKSKKGIQGDPIKIKCEVHGFPVPVVNWTKDGMEIDFGDRIKTVANNGIENSTLKINPLEYEDKGNYTCQVANEFGGGETHTIIRVKDRLAALWPFLGICCEVAILCAIIFFFERRHAKKMREEEDEDPATTDGLINHNKEDQDDDLRKRNVNA